MYGKRADGRARFRIKIGGYSPIEIKAAAECRIDAINLGYIITYDQSKQFRFTDTLTRHFNPPPPVVRCGAPNSNRNKSTNSHASNIRASKPYAPNATHRHTFYGTYVVFTHTSHNGTMAKLSLPLMLCCRSPLLIPHQFHFYIMSVSVSALDGGNVKHQLESA